LKYLSYIILRFLIVVFSLVPFTILYIFSDFITFLLYRVLSYRSSVINKNIDFCFPSSTQTEKRSIISQFYENFTDIILESLKGLGTDRQKLKSRYQLLNPDILDSHYNNKQSIVIYSQHYNNWEWGALTLGLQMSHHVVGIVKKISNDHVNDYVQSGRSGHNVSVVAMEDIQQLYKRKYDKPIAIVFIADQMPFRSTRNHDVSFMNKEVAFHKGAAIYACSKDYPVYSIDIHRKDRGQYELELISLCEHPKQVSPIDLTQLYVANLEKLIKYSPGSWLWSHKRFKKEIQY
jgi:Kdo2-lipid IVA lauroyltransferase/acyltransferase